MHREPHCRLPRLGLIQWAGLQPGVGALNKAHDDSRGQAVSPRPLLCSPSASKRKGPRSCHLTNAISTRHLGYTQGSGSHNGPGLFCQAKAGLQDSKPLPASLRGSYASCGRSGKQLRPHFWQTANDQNQGRRIQERRLERSALKTLGSQMKGYLSQLCINPLRLRHPGILKEEQLYEGSGLQYSGMKKGQPYLSRKIWWSCRAVSHGSGHTDKILPLDGTATWVSVHHFLAVTIPRVAPTFRSLVESTALSVSLPWLSSCRNWAKQ